MYKCIVGNEADTLASRASEAAEAGPAGEPDRPGSDPDQTRLGAREQQEESSSASLPETSPEEPAKPEGIPGSPEGQAGSPTEEFEMIEHESRDIQDDDVGPSSLGLAPGEDLLHDDREGPGAADCNDEEHRIEAASSSPAPGELGMDQEGSAEVLGKVSQPDGLGDTRTAQLANLAEQGDLR